MSSGEAAFSENVFRTEGTSGGSIWGPSYFEDLPEGFSTAEGLECIQHGRRGAWASGVAAAKATIIAGEILPFNELLRYGSLTGVQAITHNPVVGAAVLGLSTFAVEGGGALAASSWIAEDKIKDVLDGVHRKVSDTKLSFLSPLRYMPDKFQVSPLAEAGVAMTMGTIALLEVKQRADPTRTAEQNRRHGLMTASWMAGLFAVEGALISKGIEDYHNPVAVGSALLGIAGLFAFVKGAKKRLFKSGDGEDR